MIGVCRGGGGDGVYVVTVIELAFGLSRACVNSPDPLRFIPPSPDSPYDDSEMSPGGPTSALARPTSAFMFFSVSMVRSLLKHVMNSPDGLRVRGLIGGRGL